MSPSRTVRDRFIAFGYPPERIEIVPYGVDPMPPYTFDKGRHEGVRFGFIGSINKPKGLHVLIEAMLRVQDHYGNRDNKLRARMKWLVDTMGIDELRTRIHKERKLLIG